MALARVSMQRAAAGAASYAPSWVDRLDGWIAAQRGPRWVSYLVTALVLVDANTLFK